MRKVLLLLALAVVISPTIYSDPYPIKLIESPWATRELYYINGSLWWKHEIKANYARIPFGNLILWYPVYGKSGTEINITVEYSWNGLKEYLGESVSTYVIALGYSGLYRSKWFSDGLRKYFAEIPANRTNFKKICRVKLPRGSGILILIVELYKEYPSPNNLVSEMFIFSIIVNCSKELDFSEKDYNKALEELNYYEKLLYEHIKYKSIFEKMLNESSVLKKEVKILKSKIVELNETKKALLEKLVELNKINSYLKNNVSNLENTYKELYLNKSAILREINDYKLKATIFLLATLLLILGSVKYKRRKVIVFLILIFPPLLFSQPSSVTIVSTNLWKLEIFGQLEENIQVSCKTLVLANENISLEKIDYLFRVDKTGLGWVDEFVCTSMSRKQYSLQGEFSKSIKYDSRIPIEKDCSYMLKISFGSSKLWNTTYVYLNSVYIYEGYSIIVLVYSFEGDFFHSFGKIFNLSDVLCIKCLKSRNILLAGQIAYVNKTIEKLRKTMAELSNTTRELEVEVSEINESVKKVSKENNDLKERINYLESKISRLKAELSELSEERALYFNVHVLSVVFFVVAVLVEAALFLKKKLKYPYSRKTSCSLYFT